MTWALITWLVCTDCYSDFRFDESPSPARCAECSAWRAWWFGTDDLVVEE